MSSGGGPETSRSEIPKFEEDGHFGSPIVDVASLEARKAQLWPALPRRSGVDYRESAQHELFLKLAPLIRDMGSDAAWPKAVIENAWFGAYDAIIYVGMLRWLRPARLIEIGAGYSTRVALEVRARYLGGELPKITCIEPYPQRIGGLGDAIELIERPVWDVDPSIVDALGPNDIFFVDASHVSKTGSDTHTIYFELLPRLSAGVYVHVHDIFLPFEYPYAWVVEEGHHWNEQYLLEAL
ncbi:MAG: class I SAM-dependent methyltransferase, partial [Candidatus Eremiobacteraeota bacterium]|nr:class I SAM-dependent methyltransferase [Candidatus Eremiobacteraeota bacterium]